MVGTVGEVLDKHSPEIERVPSPVGRAEPDVFICCSCGWVSSDPDDDSWSAHFLSVLADLRENAVERLAEIINDLDCICGNGNTGDGPKLGLDWGTAKEWASAILAKEAPAL